MLVVIICSAHGFMAFHNNSYRSRLLTQMIEWEQSGKAKKIHLFRLFLFLTLKHLFHPRIDIQICVARVSQDVELTALFIGTIIK
jgi:hypothetical protein